MGGGKQPEHSQSIKQLIKVCTAQMEHWVVRRVSDKPMQFSMRATSKPGSPRNFEVASLQLAASCRVCGPDATQLCCHRLKVHGTIGHQSIGRTRYVPIGIQPIFSCFHGTVPHTFPSFVPNPLAARVCVC